MVAQIKDKFSSTAPANKKEIPVADGRCPVEEITNYNFGRADLRKGERK